MKRTIPTQRGPENMASKEQNERSTAARLADLLKAERTRHGVCEGSLTSLIKVQKKYITSLTKRIAEMQTAYMVTVAANLTRGKD
jgi:hypothetical protein